MNVIAMFPSFLGGLDMFRFCFIFLGLSTGYQPILPVSLMLFSKIIDPEADFLCQFFLAHTCIADIKKAPLCSARPLCGGRG